MSKALKSALEAVRKMTPGSKIDAAFFWKALEEAMGRRTLNASVAGHAHKYRIPKRFRSLGEGRSRTPI